jgi:hydroxyacyl-ACP dehydratase HTD2-like protein with hotdog domain
VSARLSDVAIGDALPERAYTPDNIQLFFYNAVLWNAHRIHYDLPYATEAEGYPGLVIAGPLLGDWLTQCVLEWMDGDGELVSFEYSNRLASYIGETLTVGGSVTAIDEGSGVVDLELAVRNEADEIITPGTARVRFL